MSDLALHEMFLVLQQMTILQELKLMYRFMLPGVQELADIVCALTSLTKVALNFDGSLLEDDGFPERTEVLEEVHRRLQDSVGVATLESFDWSKVSAEV